MGTKLRNMLSKNGKKVANQFIITDGGKEVFQSYEMTIAIKQNGTVTLDETYWDYSQTTSKYRNMFLEETTAETKKKIASGEYRLANLN